MEAWVIFLVGLGLGAVGTAVGFWFRDMTMDAERWGTSLKLDGAMAEEPSSWQGLEDVRVRVRPIYDHEKEKKA